MGIPGKSTQGINVQILPFHDLSGLTNPFGLGWVSDSISTHTCRQRGVEFFNSLSPNSSRCECHSFEV